MMIMANAYGLRGWKPERIFQRKFCIDRLVERGIKIVEDDDNVNLESYDVTRIANQGSDAMTERLNELKIIADILAQYHKRLMTHYGKIETAREKILSAYANSKGGDNVINQKLVHVQTLSSNYANVLGNVGDLQKAISVNIRTAEKAIDAQYRKEIGSRVRQARQAKGATQLEAAMAARVSRGMIAAFERGEKEISFPTFKRLINFFGVTANDMLFQ